MIDFNIVTPEWIRSQIQEKGIKIKDVAEGINTSSSRMSKYLAGDTIPPIAKAALYYYFEIQDV